MSKSRKSKSRKIPPKQLEHLTLQLFLRHPKKRLNAKQIVKKLKINNSKNSVQEVLDRLAQKGKIDVVKDDKYRISGQLQAQDQSGPSQVYDGFVDMTRTGSAYIICDGLEDDIYVPSKKLKLAMDGDKVRVQVTGTHRQRTEGVVIEVLERTTDKFIGDFQQSKNFGFVVPDNRMIPFDIYVYPDQQGAATDGDKVMVQITDWPDRPSHNPVGKIVKVLDASDTHTVMMESILINHGFDMEFHPAVRNEADQLPREISDAEIGKRRDYRKVTTFTIDPATAKDFDDALSLQTLENGNLEIGIHIADVTHYVKPGSNLDKEALDRATSVYLVDRVAPMLPEILSNELCSLRPDEDSLTFSAIFEFNSDHNIVKRWFGKCVIHSQRRFSYEEAQAIIDGEAGPFSDELKALDKLAHILRKRRLNEGSIAFESPEVQFELNEVNHPISIHTKQRLDTHMLVEDFMLLANREVAQYIHEKEEKEIPFVYRVHDVPDEEKLKEYALFLKELGFNFDYQTPRKIKESFNRLSEEARADEVLAFAEPFAVRTMAKAVYTTDNIGHFGLGFDHYTHFTSPIRRYADVLVHRILEKNLSGVYREKKNTLEQQCKHISNQEKKAQEAERESIKFKQVEYISDHIGEEFTGIISGMIDRGFFVALEHTQIEGMVGFDTMNEPFTVAENRMQAHAHRSKKTLKIGQKVKVIVQAARIEDMEVDMVLAEDH